MSVNKLHILDQLAKPKEHRTSVCHNGLLTLKYKLRANLFCETLVFDNDFPVCYYYLINTELGSVFSTLSRFCIPRVLLV